MTSEDEREDFLKALKQAHCFNLDSFYLLLLKGENAMTADRTAVMNNEMMHVRQLAQSCQV